MAKGNAAADVGDGHATTPMANGRAGAGVDRSAGVGMKRSAGVAMKRGAGTRGQSTSLTRRFARRVVQHVAVLVALLILYYATSLHGISSRTFVLVAVLILCLYWIFKGVL